LSNSTSAPAANPNPTEPPIARPQLHRFADVIGQVETEARAAYEARMTGKPRGPLTGLKRVDAELGGALPPGVSIVLGNTGTGKTAFVLQASASCPFPALLVSCEMAPAELFRRHMARVSGDFLHRFKSGELHPDDIARKARQAAEAAPFLSIVDATRAYASPTYLRDCAEIVKGDAPHLLLVVDSLHSWAEGATDDKGRLVNAPEYEALNIALAALRTLARQLSCPVLVVCEQNRASMGGPNSGGANSGAGTRRIEYGAEVVLDLYREKDAREDGAGEVEVTLKFAKNRNGAAGKSVKLLFNGALQRFREA
jgi:replicative DNA helicase